MLDLIRFVYRTDRLRNPGRRGIEKLLADREARWRRLVRPARMAVVTQRPGFYPSGAAFTYLAAARLPGVRLLHLSVFAPVEDTVARLNEYQPEFVTGYASALEDLAREQEAARLRL